MTALKRTRTKTPNLASFLSVRSFKNAAKHRSAETAGRLLFFP